MIIKSRPWTEVAEFYRDLTERHGWDMQPMLQFVERIAGSGYATGIHPATSMATLLMAQHPKFVRHQNTLSVHFQKGRFVFEYSESPSYSNGTARSRTNLTNNWSKECGRDEAFSTFEHVMRRLRWFVDV
jgi:hypothetical protein